MSRISLYFNPKLSFFLSGEALCFNDIDVLTRVVNFRCTKFANLKSKLSVLSNVIAVTFFRFVKNHELIQDPLKFTCHSDKNLTEDYRCQSYLQVHHDIP